MKIQYVKIVGGEEVKNLILQKDADDFLENCENTAWKLYYKREDIVSSGVVFQEKAEEGKIEFVSEKFQFVLLSHEITIRENNSTLVIRILDREGTKENMIELMNVFKLGLKNREQNSSQSLKSKIPYKRNPFEGYSFPDMRA